MATRLYPTTVAAAVGGSGGRKMTAARGTSSTTAVTTTTAGGTNIPVTATVNGVVVALTDYNLPKDDPEKAKAIPRTVERASQVARNRINHGQNYDGSKKGK